MGELTQSALAAMIDHTLLKPEASRADLEKLCREAEDNLFASVCVAGYRVNEARRLVNNPQIKICAVIGFPLGSTRSEIKAMETVRAIADGAEEVDMVINIGAVKDANWAQVENDIGAVVKAARGVLVKVILETCLLSNEEIVKCCQLAVKAGAQFVKTSTGFSRFGATVEHVKLMRDTVGPDFGIKASGGIRSHQQLLDMIKAGANRIGTSQGVDLIRGGSTPGEY